MMRSGIREEMKDPKQRDMVSSLERGLRVLTAFDHDSVEMTPSDVAKKTDLPRAATRRILLTLCKLGYAVSDGKYFRLTPKVLDLSHNYVGNERIRDLIEPVMREVADRLKDSCTLNIMDGGDMVSIFCCNANAIGAINMNVGLRIPLYVSTPGRMMLAMLSKKEVDEYLARTELTPFTPHTVTNKTQLRKEIAISRESGYAIGREEWELGLYVISVPVVSASQQVVACLTVVGNAARIPTEEDVLSRVEVLNDAAHRIGIMLPQFQGFADVLRASAGI